MGAAGKLCAHASGVSPHHAPSRTNAGVTYDHDDSLRSGPAWPQGYGSTTPPLTPSSTSSPRWQQGVYASSPDERQTTDDMTALQLFGETVRTHRKARGLTQQELAAKTGLNRSYIGGIERGGRNVSLHNVLRLAVALDIPPSTLLQPLDTRPDLLPTLRSEDGS